METRISFWNEQLRVGASSRFVTEMRISFATQTYGLQVHSGLVYIVLQANSPILFMN